MKRGLEGGRYGTFSSFGVISFSSLWVTFLSVKKLTEREEIYSYKSSSDLYRYKFSSILNVLRARSIMCFIQVAEDELESHQHLINTNIKK